MRGIIILLIFFSLHVNVHAQTTITVVDSITRLPLAGVSFLDSQNKGIGITDAMGKINVAKEKVGEKWIITHLNYKTKQIQLTTDTIPNVIVLVPANNEVEEVVVSTGYYKLPKERATGSFEHISNKMLDRSVGENLLEKLEGLAPGLQFVNSNGNNSSDIRIRGLATIESDASPLIVLDNFPYEGSLSNIDPNSIESITILKDAAAASIWGARAGNGVIVLTSKGGQKDIGFSASAKTSITIQKKPDFYYGKGWLPSKVVLDIERENEKNGIYGNDNNITVPMFVEQIRRFDRGEIDEAELMVYYDDYSSIDTRREVEKYLYREATNKQTYITMQGTANKTSYRTSVAFNEALGERIGDSNTRLSMGLGVVRNLFKDFYLDWSLGYVSQHRKSNGIGIAQLDVGSIVGISPYIRVVDDKGQPASVQVSGLNYNYASQASEQGLLNWDYVPIEDRDLKDISSQSREFKFDIQLRGTVWKDLKFQSGYQFLGSNSSGHSHYFKNSYYVRNLVNRFTQPNGSLIIPHNGVLLGGNPTETASHYGRIQLTYDKETQLGPINVLVGSDIRHATQEIFPGSVLYNYDDEYLVGTNQFNFNQNYAVKPVGTQRIPNGSAKHELLTHRDISYYFNGAYQMLNKFLISSSMRWDGSNLFGVKANQRGVPLWSIGGSWLLHNEGFFKSNMFDLFKLRLTYGISGNVNKTISHYPVVIFGTDLTGLTSARVASVGNPSLRWEKVRTVNGGMDVGARRLGLNISVDAYLKNGSDLIGPDYMDPTTGVIGQYKINYADIVTRGVDMKVRGDWGIFRNARVGATFNFSFVRNEIKEFSTNPDVSVISYLQGDPAPVKGRSKDAIYSYPTSGLNPQNGLPLIYIDGQVSDRYATYHRQFNTVEDLKVSGVTIPTMYGSCMPHISMGNLELSALFLYKGGYVFRRSSMSPIGEERGNYHDDYFRRWVKPGDEQTTDVARKISLDEVDSEIRAATSVYEFGQDRITDGDLVRLQDINLTYRIPLGGNAKRFVKNISVAAYARNLGLVWRKNNHGIDPDFPTSFYRTPSIWAGAITLQF